MVIYRRPVSSHPTVTQPEAPLLFNNQRGTSPRGSISSINISATNITVNNFYFNNPGMYNIQWTAREPNGGVTAGAQNGNGFMNQGYAPREGQWSTQPVNRWTRSTGADSGRLFPDATPELSSITLVDAGEVSFGSGLMSTTNPFLGVSSIGDTFPLTSSPRLDYSGVTGSRGPEFSGGGDNGSGNLSSPNISFVP